jgi:hypothetical protein
MTEGELDKFIIQGLTTNQQKRETIRLALEFQLYGTCYFIFFLFVLFDYYFFDFFLAKKGKKLLPANKIEILALEFHLHFNFFSLSFLIVCLF